MAAVRKFRLKTVSVNGKKRTAATNVSKLQAGDMLELTFPDDRTIWKAVVIENGGDTTSTREPRRLVRIPNPWQRESPGESPAIYYTQLYAHVLLP